jgi:hypothetical protein
MLQWRVIILAVLAIALQLVGLLALTLPDSVEGPVIYVIDEGHAVSALDGVGVLLLGLGCVIAWGAGMVWQRRMYAS